MLYIPMSIIIARVLIQLEVFEVSKRQNTKRQQRFFQKVYPPYMRYQRLPSMWGNETGIHIIPEFIYKYKSNFTSFLI